MSAPRILIGAGGTAGHVVPALAVADALRADGAEVHFVGGDRAEARLVPEAGYEFHQLKVAPLQRDSPVRAAKSLVTDAGAVLAASRLIGQIGPAVVLGGGGYVSAPVGLAAALRRIPLVTVEIDGHLGMANRLLAPFARRVCTALPLRDSSDPKFVVTGRPVPRPTANRTTARDRFGIAADETLVVVFGGSQGARSINQAAIEAFSQPDFAGVRLRVLHAAGERDLPDLTAPGQFYDLRGYISGLMDALVAADLVIARSGGSVWEIAAAGKPSVLIPYPYATQDHQTANARFFTDAGAAVMITDAELTPARLAQEVEGLLQSPERLAAMASAAAAAARPRAARDIAAEVLRALPKVA